MNWKTSQLWNRKERSDILESVRFHFLRGEIARRRLWAILNLGSEKSFLSDAKRTDIWFHSLKFGHVTTKSCYILEVEHRCGIKTIKDSQNIIQKCWRRNSNAIVNVWLKIYKCLHWALSLSFPSYHFIYKTAMQQAQRWSHSKFITQHPSIVCWKSAWARECPRRCGRWHLCRRVLITAICVPHPVFISSLQHLQSQCQTAVRG